MLTALLLTLLCCLAFDTPATNIAGAGTMLFLMVLGRGRLKYLLVLPFILFALRIAS